MYKVEVGSINKDSTKSYSGQERFQFMVFWSRWLSILSVNSLMLFNVSFSLLILPSIVNGGEVVAQTDSSAEGERLLKQGFELFKQGTAESKKEAITLLKRALILYQQTGNKAGEALILFRIGSIYDDLGEKQRALNYYNQSLPLSQQLGNKIGEATTLNDIGNVYSVLGEKQTALDYYNQSLPLSQQLGNKIGEATTLNNIGNVYSDLGEKQTALDYYNQSLPLSQQVEDTTLEAITISNIGNVYSDLGEKQTALDYYNQSLPLSRQVGDKVQQATTLNNISRVYHDLGEKQTALDYSKQSLALSREVGDKLGEARTLYNIGGIYDTLGEKQTALNYYNQSLPLSQQVGNKGQEAANITGIGNIYSDLGEKQTALDYFNQSLPIFRQVGNKVLEAATLGNIGGIYSDLGEKQTALDYFNQSLPIFREVGNKAQEAVTLTSIGNVYSDLGEKQTALDYYNQSLPLSQQVGDKTHEASVINNIGNVYSDLGEKQTALDYFNQSLKLKRQVEDKVGEAVTLNNIGFVYYDLGEQQTALDYFNQSLPLLQKVGDRAVEAITLNNIGLVYYDLGEQQTALDYFKQSLLLSRQVENQAGIANTLFNFASLKRSQGKLTEALTDIESAINIIEDLRTKIISQDLRTSYFATVQDYYQFYIDLLMQLHKQNPNQGFDAKALHASERSRARTLLELLTEANANIRQGVDPNLLNQEQTILQKLDATEKRRIELVSNNHTPEQLEKITQEFASLQTQYKQLQNQIKQTSPNYAALKYPEPLNRQQIQQQVLDDDTILLEYALGADRSYLWAVTTNSITSYELPPQAEIEAAAQQFVDLLTAPHLRSNPQDLPKAATALSEIILQPVASELGNKRLLVVSDGILQYVPFAALSAPGKNTPLIVEHEIVNSPSASTIAINRSQTANRQNAPKTVAVMADPVFSADDDRVTGTAKSNNSDETVSMLRGQQITRAARQASINWERLPGTRREAEAIVAQVTDQTQRIYALDFEANKRTATNEELSQYKFVHFATHGFLNGSQPELSGIVMSLVDENGVQQNGFLYLQDVFNLKLSAELVVLSACETGLGEEVKGEGLVGLTRGFMYAGAPRVVVSLWKVNDDATAKLMSLFYEKMLVEKLKPVEALRAAKIEMLNSQEWQDPEYWAAFTLQGEWH